MPAGDSSQFSLLKPTPLGLAQRTLMVSIFKEESPKGDFNCAAKGRFFLRGGAGSTHSGNHITLSPSIS